MKYFERAIKAIDENRNREHNCIPFGFPKLENYVPGITKSTFCIITSGTKVGKTLLLNHLYVYNAYEFAIANNIPLKIFYWSMEISLIEMIVKGIIRRVYLNTGIILDRNEVLSFSKNRLSADKYNLILEQREYFEKLEDYLVIFEGSENPTGIYMGAKNYMLANGTMVNGSYTPNDPNSIFIGIIDHLALVNTEKGLTKREAMEKTSEYCVFTRNVYGCSWAVVQQQSMIKEQAQYTNSGALIEDRFEPSIDGMGDAKTVVRDCDLLLGLYMPQKHKIKKHNGMDITPYKDKYRSLKVMLNRNGEADLYVPMLFNAQVGLVKEL